MLTPDVQPEIWAKTRLSTEDQEALLVLVKKFAGEQRPFPAAQALRSELGQPGKLGKYSSPFQPNARVPASLE